VSIYGEHLRLHEHRTCNETGGGVPCIKSPHLFLLICRESAHRRGSGGGSRQPAHISSRGDGGPSSASTCTRAAVLMMERRCSELQCRSDSCCGGCDCCALPFPCCCRYSGWGRICSGQLRADAAPARNRRARPGARCRSSSGRGRGRAGGARARPSPQPQMSRPASYAHGARRTARATDTSSSRMVILCTDSLLGRRGGMMIRMRS
jgi:hypothetical protein